MEPDCNKGSWIWINEFIKVLWSFNLSKSSNLFQELSRCLWFLSPSGFKKRYDVEFRNIFSVIRRGFVSDLMMVTDWRYWWQNQWFVKCIEWLTNIFCLQYINIGDEICDNLFHFDQHWLPQKYHHAKTYFCHQPPQRVNLPIRVNQDQKSAADPTLRWLRYFAHLPFQTAYIQLYLLLWNFRKTFRVERQQTLVKCI